MIKAFLPRPNEWLKSRNTTKPDSRANQMCLTCRHSISSPNDLYHCFFANWLVILKVSDTTNIWNSLHSHSLLKNKSEVPLMKLKSVAMRKTLRKYSLYVALKNGHSMAPLPTKGFSAKPSCEYRGWILTLHSPLFTTSNDQIFVKFGIAPPTHASRSFKMNISGIRIQDWVDFNLVASREGLQMQNLMSTDRVKG